MDTNLPTTFAIKLIVIDKLAFVERHASWNVKVIVGVTSPYGVFDLTVPLEKIQSLDAAVQQAMKLIGLWGSRFGEFAQKATSVQVL